MTEGGTVSTVETEQIETLVASAGVEATQAILDAFWTSNNELIQALSSQLAEGALEDAAKSAHALKGSAANLGAVLLADYARKLEDACREMQKDTAQTVLETIPESVDKTRTVFEQILQVA